MKQIRISDATLCRAAGDRPLTFREKTNIARCLDSLGADAVELPAVRNPREDAVICRTVAAAVRGAEVCIPAGASAESAAAAWDCVKDAKAPCLQVMLPVSTVQMEYVCHLKAPKMLVLIDTLCRACRALCANVEFSAQDASRADREFLKSACAAAAAAGAGRVVLCDDAGVMLPDEFAALVRDVKSACDIPVWVQPSDAISMAAACFVSAVGAGAEGVRTSLYGDSLSPETAADIFRTKGEDLGISCGLSLTEIHQRIAGLLNGSASAAPADAVSQEESGSLALNAQSTIGDVGDAIRTLGYELSEEDVGLVYEEFCRVAAVKATMGAKELEAIIASTAMQVPSTYHLESFVSNSGNVISAMANVTLVKGGVKYSGVSTGDGPIDASFLAVEQIIGHHYELDDFQIQAVTQGREAMGSALVKLRSDGRLYSGNGISTDIIGASIRAYLNAVNKIVYEEN